MTDLTGRAYIHLPLEHTFESDEAATMTKRFDDEQIRVERDAGMPSVFEWRGRRYEVLDVIGRWRIEAARERCPTPALCEAASHDAADR